MTWTAAPGTSRRPAPSIPRAGATPRRGRDGAARRRPPGPRAHAPRRHGGARGGEGRTGYLLALAATRTGDAARAGRILDAGLEVPDLREGEDSLADLWREARPGVEVPAVLRFDMRETDGA